MRRLVTALVLMLGASPLSASFLLLDLRTNYAPGTEFRFVRVMLVDRADERRSWHTVTAVTGGDYLAGERIAEFENVARGTYLVSVELLDDRMRPVNGRVWLQAKGDAPQSQLAVVARR